ncbi:MAG: AAA family ATPase [Acidobacteria bacterium]|nr:AAA family ATPase [Acidobacteriota bacterium]
MRGLVIGKFYPPHRGHKFLIETALKAVDHLDILICVRADQSISGDLRQTWLRQLHPSASVIQVDDFGEDDNSKAWAEFTRDILGYAPDVVFTSENYGETYARYLGSQHVLVDLSRQEVPISATKVRANPLKHWEFLEPCVRAYFAARICIVGAESTGTTTLAQDLAEHYRTVWVPEYGREYCKALSASGVDLWRYQWRSEEFLQIAGAQCRLEDDLAREANRILICDTDPLATSIWHERYLKSRCLELEKLARTRRYQLYILTDCDIPFVQDGLRDGELVREWMTTRFEQRLSEQNTPWLKVSGTRRQRMNSSIDEIDQLLSATSI